MGETTHKQTNRLAKATSPYLLQHAHNPVDWYEWGSEAIEKAKREDKPIFLSIGYSACHWCHVMEHESFEDEGIAALLNEFFVSVKVDREERPDIDEIYMQATTAMTQHGGWPMSVLLSADGAPFYAGTYFPRDQFEQLLRHFSHAWRNERDALTQAGSQVSGYLQEWASAPKAREGLIPKESVLETAHLLLRHFDMRLGGMSGGNGNKFPPSMAMELMLRAHARSGEPRLLEAIELTLTNMAHGGIYDHLGGGICRYSTDPQWLVPHFEKMLYDQALVSGIYLDGFLVTHNPQYARTAASIFEYVIRDLQSPEGGIFSSRDADSEGMEGKYYVWTIGQVNEVLGQEDAKMFCSFYDVTESGNWFESMGHAPPGPKNILNIQRNAETVAKLHAIDPQELEARLADMRAKMSAARDRRVAPGLDDKILTAWNGLMIASLAKGARVLGKRTYANAAARAADFVLDNLRRDGKLLRTYRNGQARLLGYLSDYAFLVEGLLNLYEATFDVRWIEEAVALIDESIDRYFDQANGGFFFTASDGERLVVRTKNANDGAIPSGNSVQAMNLLRLSLFVNRSDYRVKAESIFRAFAPLVARSPAQFERLLCAVDFYYGQAKEIAIIAGPNAEATEAFLEVIYGSFLPNKVVASVSDDTQLNATAQRIPLLNGKRSRGGKTTVYVCENFSCKEPVTDASDLKRKLATQ